MGLEQSITRGAVTGGLISLPVGILAGKFFGDILFEADEAKAPIYFIVLVTICFVGWGVFVGAMLKAQALPTSEE